MPSARSPLSAGRAAPRAPLLAAGLLSWIAISLGFFGLRILMQERPEFVGEPMRSAKSDLVQESPQIVIRKVSDDVAVIKAAQPESSHVTFKMKGRRDYRGLQTILDMTGEFRARYVLTNTFDEPIFMLLKCPHPHAESGSDQPVQAGGLKLEASVPGIQENAKDAWLWSGTIEPQGTVSIEISYQAASLKGVTYQIVGGSAEPVKHLRVEFQRQDLASMRFDSGEGPIPTTGESVLWERKDFLAPDSFSARIAESRNLYGSLLQLLEIGPVICLLFLLAVSAVILARQPLSALQLLTIAAGYAFYFPLMLYLSSRFSFKVALVLALVAPGALLVNYARLLLGSRIGLIGGVVFLLLYQLFPTLAAFAGWNRGMVLLCLGMVTFAVLINLQNQALKRAGALALLLWSCAGPMKAADVQVIVPGKLVADLPEAKAPATPLWSFEPADYQIRHEATHFVVEAKLAFKVLRVGDAPAALFAQPVHLQQQQIEATPPEAAQLVMEAKHVALLAQKTGSGALRFTYRVAIENHEGRKRAQFPLLAGPSGNVRIESSRSDLESSTGTLWAKTPQDALTVYEFGVAGEELLVVEWREQDGGAAPPPERGKEFYGIGITRAQHLTVINSDSSCTHFAEFELPASQAEELRLRLPPKARLISVSINGVEATAPALEDQLCRIRLPVRASGGAAHRLSFRLAYPAVRLGFVGSLDLALPEVFQTIGTLEWVVALPGGFETQVISSGLELQKTTADLERFGDYGRILKVRRQSYLTKDLAPPGFVGLNLRYRQTIPALDGPG